MGKNSKTSPNPLFILEKKSGGRSYSTHRYCYETNIPIEPFYQKDQNFIFKNYGETDKPKKPINLKELASRVNVPLFSFFLDGSRRVYKVSDIQLGNRVYPVIIGQVGASCCRRNHDGFLKNFRTENRLVLTIPEVSDPEGGPKSKFFKELLHKINSDSSLIRHGHKLDKIIPYPDIKESDYADLAISDLHDEMLDMEKEFVNWLVRDQRVLNHESMLIKDGSLEYKKISRGNYKDVSILRSNYRCVVGVSKRFNPEKSFDKDGKSNPSLIARLPLYHRTPAFKFRSNVSGGEGGAVYFVAWYIRIRDIKHTISPFDGVVKVERLLVDEATAEKGLDSDEINWISAHIVWERNPTCYGSDQRWANHLYPIFLTEQNLRSRRLSDQVIMHLF